MEGFRHRSPNGAWPNRGETAILVVTIIIAVAATCGVALRFWARAIRRASFKSDDYTILAALPLGWALCILTVTTVEVAGNHHVVTVPLGRQTIYGSTLFAINFIWTIAMPLIKLSILLLYIRIFGRLRYIRIIFYVVCIFMALWAIAVVLILCLQCRPIELIWNKRIQGGSCINSNIFYLVSSIPDAITDVILLLLPLPAIWRLHNTIWQKAILTGMFVLGSG